MKYLIAFIFTALLAVALHASAHASMQDPNPSFTACSSKANTTVAMENCGKAGLADANRRVNLAYQKALPTFPTDQQAKLRSAERTWIAFREQDCRVYTGADAGSMAAPAYLSCMVDRTETRIRELAAFAQK